MGACGSRGISNKSSKWPAEPAKQEDQDNPTVQEGGPSRAERVERAECSIPVSGSSASNAALNLLVNPATQPVQDDNSSCLSFDQAEDAEKVKSRTTEPDHRLSESEGLGIEVLELPSSSRLLSSKAQGVTGSSTPDIPEMISFERQHHPGHAGEQPLDMAPHERVEESAWSESKPVNPSRVVNRYADTMRSSKSSLVGTGGSASGRRVGGDEEEEELLSPVSNSGGIGRQSPYKVVRPGTREQEYGLQDDSELNIANISPKVMSATTSPTENYSYQVPRYSNSQFSEIDQEVEEEPSWEELDGQGTVDLRADEEFDIEGEEEDEEEEEDKEFDIQDREEDPLRYKRSHSDDVPSPKAPAGFSRFNSSPAPSNNSPGRLHSHTTDEQTVSRHSSRHSSSSHEAQDQSEPFTTSTSSYNHHHIHHHHHHPMVEEGLGTVNCSRESDVGNSRSGHVRPSALTVPEAATPPRSVNQTSNLGPGGGAGMLPGAITTPTGKGDKGTQGPASRPPLHPPKNNHQQRQVDSSALRLLKKKGPSEKEVRPRTSVTLSPENPPKEELSTSAPPDVLAIDGGEPLYNSDYDKAMEEEVRKAERLHQERSQSNASVRTNGMQDKLAALKNKRLSSGRAGDSRRQSNASAANSKVVHPSDGGSAGGSQHDEDDYDEDYEEQREREREEREREEHQKQQKKRPGRKGSVTEKPRSNSRNNGAAADRKTSRVEFVTEEDGASEVICEGNKQSALSSRGFDRPLSPHLPPSAGGQPKVQVSSQQIQLLSQRHVEVELLLRLDLSSSYSRHCAFTVVERLHEFLYEVHSMASACRVEPQAIFQHLLQRLALEQGHQGTGMDASLLRMQCQDQWGAMVRMDEAIVRSYARTIEPRKERAEAYMARMMGAAAELRQIVCIKVQDNNDLRTAGKALEDALEYFRLRAYIEEMDPAAIQDDNEADGIL